MRATLAAVALVAWLAASVASAASKTTIPLDPATAAHRYDGIGGLSAGASSRLLWDYEEPQRSDVLDYLFKPGFGASLAINKVEIGGSIPSTDGAEPAIAPNGPADLNCERISYEGWLIAEAQKRNPSIVHYALSWGVPGWVGDGEYYSQQNVDLHMQWLECVRNATGVRVGVVGLWNERSVGAAGLDWAVRFRAALDGAGYGATKIVVPDGNGDTEGLLSLLAGNKTWLAAVDAFGLHYPCNKPLPQVDELGLAYWASEDFSSDTSSWATSGAVWGRVIVQHYVTMNVTAVISWSTVWSVLEDMVCENAGLTRAATPWSGHYYTDSALWASAHVTQFAQPGWRYLSVPGGGSGTLEGGGHYVTMVDDAASPTQFVTVIETLDAPGGRCVVKPAPTAPQTAVLRLAKGMPRPSAGTGADLWKTNETHSFVLVASGIRADEQPDGTALLALPEPVQPDALYTLASHPGAQSHGRASTPVPASAPFPTPYNDDFETPGAPGTTNTLMARYWSDQYGLFERVQTGGARGFVLQQQLYNEPGSNSWGHSKPPLTVTGDFNWSDYTVSVDLQLPSDASVAGAIGDVGLVPCLDASDPALPFQAFANNTPSAAYLKNGGVHTCLNVDGCGGAGSGVILYQCIAGSNTCDGPPPPGQRYNTLNLEWDLAAAGGALTSRLNGLCVEPTASATVRRADAPAAGTFPGPGLHRRSGHGGGAPAVAGPAPSPLQLGTCASPLPPSQSWTRLPTGQVRHDGSGQCLGTKAPSVFVMVCGRMSRLNGFQGTITQVCLQLNATSWSVVEDNGADATALASGPLPQGARSADGWASVALAFQGQSATASVGGSKVATVALSDPGVGMVSLGSGFHAAAFDNVRVELL